MARHSIFAIAALAALVNSAVVAEQAAAPLAGRWQYLQAPDHEGEVLDLFASSGSWRGIMNGLDRAGEHGLFYYVVEIENLTVEPNGDIRFGVGERLLFNKRPILSQLGGSGDAGIVRYRMRFTGRIEAGDLVLRCEDKYGSCPDSTLRFKRLGATLEPNQPLHATPDDTRERRR